EVVVCDAADGRFIPVAKVFATLIDPDGNDLGTHEQPLMWHPMMYHYGRNWTVPADGTYTLKVRVEPPTIHRHDEVNGKRFTEPVEVEFTNVKVKRGKG
ncbi:MAG TPA: iron transporter, partial [Arthrobacter sp.]|nr:iron transporter [Arthrobacter sp.]